MPVENHTEPALSRAVNLTKKQIRALLPCNLYLDEVPSDAVVGRVLENDAFISAAWSAARVGDLVAADSEVELDESTRRKPQVSQDATCSFLVRF